MNTKCAFCLETAAGLAVEPEISLRL